MSHALTELQLLNAAIDSGDPYFLSKLGVDAAWFPTFGAAYRFITDHIREHGAVPTLTTVAGAVDGFEFAEHESPDILKRKLGDALAKRDLAEWLKTVDTSKPFDRLEADIVAKTRELEQCYGVKRDTATNWRTDGEQRFATYLDRESNKRTLIPSGFAEVDKALTGRTGGAFVKGDYIVIYGRTKRGKSHLVRKLTTLPAVRAGFRVLDICLENERAEIEFMLDSMEAADLGTLEVTHGGVKMAAGFDRKRLVYGYLDAAQKAEYERWTRQFNESNAAYGDYIIKTFEDADMDFVDLRKIEALINEHKPDVMLIDPIYLTTYPRVNEKTPGGGAQAMSRALRRLATRKQVVIAVTVQATLDEGGRDDDEGELKVPDISKVKTSKSLLEDGTVTFGIDSNQQACKAVIEVMLSRKGGAGARVDLQYLPNYGIVRSIDEAIRAQLEAAEAVGLF